MMSLTNPVVGIEQGKLEGKVSSTKNNKLFYTFKGIPYAKPPTGELRFSEPVPPEPWQGLKDATKDCNICAQFDRATEDFDYIGDEDCLYLNVYTPNLPSVDLSLLPVMVYFHGGGFVFGQGTDYSTHGPDFLVEKDVVIVSLNYRLGILGFLSLDCKEATGNMGLKDQVLALKWVQKNISKFGGDPNNVTIFGISAGGASVEYLLLSPTAKGLFHKAIAQSGSSLLHWAQNGKVKELAFAIPALKGIAISNEEELLKYLKSLSTKELIMSSMQAIAGEKFHGGIHFGFVPTIEKPADWEPFLDKSTYDLLSRGEFTKVPFLAGFCTREGLIMVPIRPSALDELVKEKDFVEYLPFEFDETHNTEMRTRIQSVYVDPVNKYTEKNAFAIDFFTDVDFLGGIYVGTSFIAKNNSPVYLYEFSYDGGLNFLKKKYQIEYKGACHGDDGGYILKNSILPDNLSDTDKLVRDRMIEMWTNFAKYGNPTPNLNNLITTRWEPMTASKLAYLAIDENLTMKYELYTERMRLFEELYSKYRASD